MNKTTKEIALQALIAAVYVAITFVFQSMSFMPQQFRISESMLILVLFNPKHILGLTLGTIIANSFSTVGLIDIAVGSFASYVSLWFMVRLKDKYMKYLAPAVVNGIIVGLMLAIVFELNFVYAMGSVFASEVLVTFVPWVLIGEKVLKNEELKRIFG